MFGVFPNMCSCSRGKSLLEQNGEVFLPGLSPSPPLPPSCETREGVWEGGLLPVPTLGDFRRVKKQHGSWSNLGR